MDTATTSSIKKMSPQLLVADVDRVVDGKRRVIVGVGVMAGGVIAGVMVGGVMAGSVMAGVLSAVPSSDNTMSAAVRVVVSISSEKVTSTESTGAVCSPSGPQRWIIVSS